MQLIFVSHPQVVVDPAVPVECWHLSQAGRAVLQQFLESNILPVPDMIWGSKETKAQESAALLGAYFNKTVQSHSALGENGRSATGFLPPAEFEQVVGQFFAQPHHSVRGWERAADAQARICTAVRDIMDAAAKAQHKAVIICGHGATGTLLYCALAGLPVSRRYDQPSQGHYWHYDHGAKQMLHHWRNINDRA